VCSFSIGNGRRKCIGIRQLRSQVKQSMQLGGAEVLAHLIQVPFDGGIRDQGVLLQGV